MFTEVLGNVFSGGFGKPEVVENKEGKTDYTMLVVAAVAVICVTVIVYALIRKK